MHLTTSTSYGTLLFMTPVGQSYSCQKEISVVLSDPNVPTLRGYVLLRAFTVQPFIFKNDDFGPGKSIFILPLNKKKLYITIIINFYKQYIF